MVANELVEKQMVSRMEMDNPWWASGAIREDYKALMPRAYLDSFHAMVTNMSVKRAFILMGPRRVGKTVMIYHTIQRLTKASRHKTLFISRWKRPFITALPLSN